MFIDDELAGKLPSLNGNMQNDREAQLPFSAPTIYARNGDTRLESLSVTTPGLYYGGWEAEVDDLIEFYNQAGLNVLPQGWAQYNAKGRSETYLAAITRFVIVAPIAKRFAWFDDNCRTPDYKPGLRGWAQSLCLLGVNTSIGITPVGPVVLSVKGNQSKEFLNILSTWDTITREERAKIDKRLPAWLFYLSCGTFGKAPIFKEVGARQKSTITPITLYRPPSVTRELLERLYVGIETAKQMTSWAVQAEEWVNAWNEPAQYVQPHSAKSQPAQVNEPSDSMPF